MKQDDIWKDTIETLFNQFVEFFMPDVYPDINFKHKPKSLDKEYNKLFPKSNSKNRRADKLVEVKLKNDKKQILFIHIEVQGYNDKEFDLRMFQYYYRIFDKSKGGDIEAIAIFTDDKNSFKPAKFERKPYETHLSYKYRTYNVIEHDEENLLKNKNPFALAILAVLYEIKSRGNEDKKLKFSLNLAELLFKRGYNDIVIVAMIKFISVLLEVTDSMKQELYIEEVDKMAQAEKKLEVKSWLEEFLINKNNAKLVKNMRLEGLSDEAISRILGISKKEISKIK